MHKKVGGHAKGQIIVEESVYDKNRDEAWCEQRVQLSCGWFFGVYASHVVKIYYLGMLTNQILDPRQSSFFLISWVQHRPVPNEWWSRSTSLAFGNPKRCCACIIYLLLACIWNGSISSVSQSSPCSWNRSTFALKPDMPTLLSWYDPMVGPSYLGKLE